MLAAVPEVEEKLFLPQLVSVLSPNLDFVPAILSLELPASRLYLGRGSSSIASASYGGGKSRRFDDEQSATAVAAPNNALHTGALHVFERSVVLACA